LDRRLFACRKEKVVAIEVHPLLPCQCRRMKRKAAISICRGRPSAMWGLRYCMPLCTRKIPCLEKKRTGGPSHGTTWGRGFRGPSGLSPEPPTDRCLQMAAGWYAYCKLGHNWLPPLNWARRRKDRRTLNSPLQPSMFLPSPIVHPESDKHPQYPHWVGILTDSSETRGPRTCQHLPRNINYQWQAPIWIPSLADDRWTMLGQGTWSRSGSWAASGPQSLSSQIGRGAVLCGHRGKSPKMKGVPRRRPRPGTSSTPVATTHQAV